MQLQMQISTSQCQLQQMKRVILIPQTRLTKRLKKDYYIINYWRGYDKVF